MKRFLCLALVLALLMITLPVVRAEKLTALWTANPENQRSDLQRAQHAKQNAWPHLSGRKR